MPKAKNSKNIIKNLQIYELPKREKKSRQEKFNKQILDLKPSDYNRNDKAYLDMVEQTLNALTRS